MASKTAFRQVEVVEVMIWGDRAGAVALEPSAGFYAFEYDPRFVRKGIELAPLAMPLAQADQRFMFTALPEATYQRLPALLADALPDKFGNALIDAWMAERGLTHEQVTPLDRLAYMGRRGMGALSFRPLRGPAPKVADAVEMATLVEAARQVLAGNFGDPDHAAAALRQIMQVGTSAGGARAKATIAWNPQSDEIRAGQFDMPEGFEPWLLKFDGVGADIELGASHDYGRIEYAYHLMARAAGIVMNDCRLLQENGRAHFMTRRFDRSGNARHHVQSLCALAHLDFNQRATHSYHQLLATADRLGLQRPAFVELLRRMVFNVLAANCDDHTKNFAFLLREGSRWELAPAFDLTHAYNPRGAWTYQHLMSVNGKFSGITRADIIGVAERFDLLAEVGQVIDEVQAGLARWEEFAKLAGVAPDEIARIGTLLRELHFTNAK